MLYCLTQAKIKKIIKGTKSRGVETIIQSKEMLQDVQKYGKEAMQILSLEPEGAEDHTLSERIVQDLIQVKTMLDFANMKDL